MIMEKKGIINLANQLGGKIFIMETLEEEKIIGDSLR